MRCQVCPIAHIPNSIFCDECGAYLPKGKKLDTEPLEVKEIRWMGEAQYSRAQDVHPDDTHPEDIHPKDMYPQDTYQPNGRPLTIRLRISSCVANRNQFRELQISLAKPTRLGRADPAHGIFPEVDLTQDLAKEHGVSRQHACIFQEDTTVQIEDLGSINGTLLNEARLDPFIAETLKDGDQFQMGNLLIEVSFEYWPD
jgi:hypothetical protein